ncbi:hypothetical protein NSB24_02360 [Blautia coccoides]|uniref:hypothetical protein n=1 Tax=Blautia producta TaxID=33035 RepID=UPI002149E0EF|nr:hypothetical protein [Blautia coccoides]MCR1985071.1 hypothetical protein [Blautia coccoides]
MSNCYGITRTNYFEVTDREAFNRLLEELSSEDEIHVWEEKINGKTKYGFGSSAFIQCLDECEDNCMDDFVSRLSHLLPDGEAFILTEIAYEKLRYVGAGCYIATNKEHTYLDLNTCARKKAAEMLGLTGEEEFDTQMDY